MMRLGTPIWRVLFLSGALCLACLRVEARDWQASDQSNAAASAPVPASARESGGSGADSGAATANQASPNSASSNLNSSTSAPQSSAAAKSVPTNSNAIQPATAAGTIRGVVKSGNMPIPGAGVSISLAAPDQKSGGAGILNLKITTWSDVDGTYSAKVPAYGTYAVRVEMAAFAHSTQNVVVDAVHQSAVANFELTLLSRTREISPVERRAGTQGYGQRGFQMLTALQNMTGQDTSAGGMSDVVPSGMPVPGIDPN
ncbi:MAG: carboxypeptidase-like regulatory domain-containing protein, partial [Candidatus Sulfotelmatobacter sp.]